MELKDKVVLVTGASKGIGAATAIAFAKEGSKVIINFKSDAKAVQQVLKECNKYSSGNFVIQTDVANEKDILELFDQLKKKFHKLDILINNAGTFDDNDNPTNLEAFENLYKNNFLSVVMITKIALQLMKKGKIINVSSIHGQLRHGRPGAIAYSAFKAALENYSMNLAKDLAPEILVNVVAPGRVATPMWGSPNQKEQHKLGKVHLINRMIQPEEIADGIIFLSKNDAVDGEVLTIDGGYSLLTIS